MPTYVFRNLETGKTFEVTRSIHDDSPVLDPETGSSVVEKVMQPVAVSFQGSGFYSTTYRKNAHGHS